MNNNAASGGGNAIFFFAYLYIHISISINLKIIGIYIYLVFKKSLSDVFYFEVHLKFSLKKNYIFNVFNQCFKEDIPN